LCARYQDTGRTTHVDPIVARGVAFLRKLEHDLLSHLV
jgi:hypothetical protein